MHLKDVRLLTINKKKRVFKNDQNSKLKGERQMKKGTVKWFDSKRGYGFIAGEYGQDYFVHHTGIVDHQQLEEGQSVVYAIGENDKGEVATNVVIES